MIAGESPIVIGTFELDPVEMMFVQYLPIRMPGTDVRLPPHVQSFEPLVRAIEWGTDDYVYLTAKHMYVSRERMFNRPGWHADGFGTLDVNYVWSDHAPTEFCVQPFFLDVDCDRSMVQMEAQADPRNVRTYGSHVLIRLDDRVIHRAPAAAEPGYRTFAKLSVSKDRYNLVGNAHNYLFDYSWDMAPRAEARNHPAVTPQAAIRATCLSCGASTDPYGNLPCGH
jgi:hypothetical protein